MSEANVAVNNGVNVEALLGAREALTEAPQAAQFVWRAESVWQNGTHTRSTINKFFGLGEMQDRGKRFEIDTDHPEVFAAEDKGATPVEMVLVGLAGCITGGIASVAQNRFRSVTVSYEIDADATEDEIAALVAQSQKRSAVFDIITNPTNVNVEVNT